MEAAAEADVEEGLDDAADTQDAASSSPESVRWRMAWDDGGVDVGASSWITVNDLGYEIEVEAGWIGTWGATLVECGEALAFEGDRGVASPWLVAEGHNAGADDPSAQVFDRVESLVDRVEVASDVRELDGARYCEAHLLMAAIGESSGQFEAAEAALLELDPSAELLGASVLIIGRWRASDDAEPTPFVLRSAQAYGKILPLEIEAEVSGAAEVVVTRRLDTAFDGIDFAAVEADAAAWTVIGNLARQARFAVRPG